MRMMSAAQMKKSRPQNQKIPKEGTALRKTYDKFQRKKGKVIKAKFSSGTYCELEALKNFYGLDIRRIENGKWCLVGEWFGKEYVDYLAKEIAK